jgi:hypothetical protein
MLIQLSYLLAGLCPFGGVILYDSMHHLGTFCEDGTYTLPVNHKLNLGHNILTIIPYASTSLASILFTFRLGVSMNTKGMINICHSYMQPPNDQSPWNNFEYGLNTTESPSKKIVYYWYHNYLSRNSYCTVEYWQWPWTSNTAHIETLLLEKSSGVLKGIDLNPTYSQGEMFGCPTDDAAHTVSVTTMAGLETSPIYESSQFLPKHHVPIQFISWMSVFLCDTCHNSYTVISISSPGLCYLQQPFTGNNTKFILPDHIITTSHQTVYVMQKCGTIDIHGAVLLFSQNEKQFFHEEYGHRKMKLTVSEKKIIQLIGTLR